MSSGLLTFFLVIRQYVFITVSALSLGKGRTGEINKLGEFYGKKKKVDNADNYQVRIDQPFFNLKQAWIIKGCCCTWLTFKTNRFIQPKGGFYDGFQGGKGVFTNEIIISFGGLYDRYFFGNCQVITLLIHAGYAEPSQAFFEKDRWHS